MTAQARELTDGRLILRTPLLDDADLQAEAVRASLPELQPWMPWAGDDYGRDQARAWIESPTDAQGDPVSSFLIFEHGVLVGSCGMHFRSATCGEIGFWVRTSATGRGIATAATLLLARHGFDELRLSKIFIRADPANGASQRVAAKAGGRLQGELQLAPSGHTHPDGSFHELVEFVLEPKDSRDNGPHIQSRESKDPG